MSKQFIQVTARKGKDFALCSNLSAMDAKMTSGEAIAYLEQMAAEYAKKGYDIEWTRKDFDEVDEKMFGDLFT